MLTYQLQEGRTRRATEEKERAEVRMIVAFLIGLFFGVLFGMVLTAVLVAHRDEDDVL